MAIGARQRFEHGIKHSFFAFFIYSTLPPTLLLTLYSKMEQCKKGEATYTSQTSVYNTQVQCVLQHTTIGGVTELQDTEYRVVLTPALARECVQNGHTVYCQTGFGTRAGFSDEQYKQAGVKLLNGPEEVYKKSNIMLKVSPPQPSEFDFVQPQQIIFCLTNTTREKEQQAQQLIKAMTEKKVTLISYNNLMANTCLNNPITASFPVHNGLCEVAGYLAVQQAMKLMEVGGMGTLMGHVSGIPGAKVLIIGANPCGARAACFAAAAGAKVIVTDTNMDALRSFRERFHNVQTMAFSQETLEGILPRVTVLMGCVVPTFTRAPVLVTEAQLQMMRQGAIAVDVAACAGGNFEATTPTTIQKPTYNWKGITMYTATDITCMAPHTASMVFCQSALPYVLQVANKGWKKAVLEFAGLQEGVCTAEGQITNNILAKVCQCNFTPLEQILENEIHQLNQQQTNVMNLKQQLTTFRTQQIPHFTIEA